MNQEYLAKTYRDQVLVGATGVELIVALYDGAIRFLYRAQQAVIEEDVRSRRLAVKRALDIMMYLQARLRPDVDGKTAQVLSDFYAAMFQLTLEASYDASAEALMEVILCLKNVRDAWILVARDPDANKALPRELRTKGEALVKSTPVLPAPENGSSSRSRAWAA